MVQEGVDRVVEKMASLLSGPGKKMIEQDLWKLADSIIDGAFSGLEELLVRNLIRFHRSLFTNGFPFFRNYPLLLLQILFRENPYYISSRPSLTLI